MTLITVDALLDKAKAAHSIPSDYKLAQVLGVTDGAVRNYRHGRSMPDDLVIMKLCELSGDDPEYVAACIQSQRAANDESAGLWSRVAERLKSSANVLVTTLVATLFAALTTDQAYAAAALLDSSAVQSVYYVKSLVDWLGVELAYWWLCQVVFHALARAARLIWLKRRRCADASVSHFPKERLSSRPPIRPL